ncbi:RidA family protein [Mucilaginibacter roseus]|uniref:RidA family protein n=1 Tax=Mucilaginibacter roseus TaxID=1528868 RepID=A0ABS8U654_9SPHI|nr:RidA family protein [Mucilaginibacter roseus]MCD8741046.1 RidA family protein [Mucilaginibacter roseus]
MDKIHLFPLFCFILISLPGCGAGDRAKNNVKRLNDRSEFKQKWHWKSLSKQNEDAGYAQVVKAGNTIYISGIPTADLSSKGIAGVYADLSKSLSAFGAKPKDIVKETLYTTDIETMKKYNEARKAFYQGDYPAATWVQVSRLYEPDAKLEIELIAQLPNEE